MTRLLLAVLTLCAMYVGASAQTFDARFPDLTFQDSECTRTIPVALCYPTTDTAQSVRYAGVHTGQAARGGAFAPGRLPLVILSHGTGGNRFNQFHFGETLARNGYIVATIEYPGDRTFDNGDFGTAKNLYNRPRDMSFAIDALHADSDLREPIDGARIAAFGHSAGGYTAIAAAGGRPHIERLMDYCRKIPGKRMTQTDLASAPRNDAPLHVDFLFARVSLKDTRIIAAIATAPAIGPMFDSAGLSEIDIPVLVIWVGRDEILDEPANSQFYLDVIPGAAEYAMPEVGHFTFPSECPDMLRNLAPTICADPPDVNRAAAHHEMESEILIFLNRHVGG